MDHDAPHLDRLREFAQVAELHFREMCGQQVELTLELADGLLQRIEYDPADPKFDILMMCFGAWFGEYCLSLPECVARQGCWIALNEPVAPRIQIGQCCYSPIEAVRARVRGSHMATTETTQSSNLVELVAKLLSDIAEHPNETVWETRCQEWQRQNRTAWAKLANESRFAMQLESLTPEVALQELDPWLQDEGVEGKAVLCLAGGGGTHGPLLSMAGARVTVVDASEDAIELDLRSADALDLKKFKAICSDMRDLSAFTDGSFDIVVQPVSLCYVPQLGDVYAEIARVLKPKGVYFSQQKSPASLQAGLGLPTGGYAITARASTTNSLGAAPLGMDLPADEKNAASERAVGERKLEESAELTPGVEQWHAQMPHREAGTVEYAHSLSDLLGQLCMAGFGIEAFHEPVRADLWAPVNSAAHRACYIPPYVKWKARRLS